MALLKQKTLWLGVLGALAALSVFGAAMIGSIAGAKPQALPVALVVLDEPVRLPSGETLAVGAMVKEKLLANAQLPVKWDVVGTEAEARAGMDAQAYYGALILPADMSAGVLSLQTGSPRPGVVQIVSNDGMNMQAATAVKQILQQAMKLIGHELSKQALGSIGKQTPQLPVAAAQSLLTPIEVREETVHPVGANHASGSAPGMLTQILWIGCLIASAILFLTARKTAADGARSGTTVLLQTIVGIVLTGAVSGFIVWMASGWYGMELANAGKVWLALWLAGLAFFFLQSSLLVWIGLPAMAVLVLLMFFSMPVLNLAPEFLPRATHDWLYSWTPLRFAASELRQTLYFDGVASSAPNAAVLWWVAGVGLALQLASALRKGGARERNGGAVSAAAEGR
ncbi:YhgE/Pip domain-containing protein [Paenibacillus sp. GYB003]|uniref:YhgE/Pip domain-containing protein n=1 Tax=Paenibacillus sp. GYB003 TaxID=2994392 RepID=UPI002F962992